MRAPLNRIAEISSVGDLILNELGPILGRQRFEMERQIKYRGIPKSNKDVHLISNSEKTITDFSNFPSLKKAILILLLYLFGIVPLARGVLYFAVLAGFSLKAISANFSQIVLLLHTILTVSLLCYLLRRYALFLLSNAWKTDFVRLLLIGCKWAVPLMAIHAIALVIPIFRHKLISDYFSMTIVSAKGITSTNLMIFSVWAISCAIFEEFVFRGIFLQKVARLLSKNLSVFLVAALFSFSHFSFSNTQINDFTNALLVGLFSGYAYLQASSCISAIVPHLFNNIVCIGFIIFIR